MPITWHTDFENHFGFPYKPVDTLTILERSSFSTLDITVSEFSERDLQVARLLGRSKRYSGIFSDKTNPHRHPSIFGATRVSPSILEEDPNCQPYRRSLHSEKIRKEKGRSGRESTLTTYLFLDGGAQQRIALRITWAAGRIRSSYPRVHALARGLARDPLTTAAESPFPSFLHLLPPVLRLLRLPVASASARLHSRGLRRAQRTLFFREERLPAARFPARAHTTRCARTRMSPPRDTSSLVGRYIAAARFFFPDAQHGTRRHPQYYEITTTNHDRHTTMTEDVGKTERARARAHTFRHHHHHHHRSFSLFFYVAPAPSLSLFLGSLLSFLFSLLSYLRLSYSRPLLPLAARPLSPRVNL